MKIDFSLQGTEAFERQMEELARQAAPTALQSLTRSAHEIMARSQAEFCPIDTGSLRASGTVVPTMQGHQVEVKLGYGGAAAPYAVYVHETNRNYRAGKSWKFLEIPLKEGLPDINRGLQEDYEQMMRSA